MSKADKQKLEQQLWNIANELRGKMGADEFRDSIMFNEKNISDEQVHIENPGLLEEKLTKR